MNVSYLAESIIANGQADLVVLGRPLRAAEKLKATNVKGPVQYERFHIF